MDLFTSESRADDVIPVSARYGTGVQQVKDWAVQQLKEGPSLYPKVQFTYQTEWSGVQRLRVTFK